MTQALASLRADGLDFAAAWPRAMGEVRRLRRGGNHNERWALERDALSFARPAFQRAYDGEPPTRIDLIAAALAHAMDSLLDDSDYAEATPVEVAA